MENGSAHQTGLDGGHSAGGGRQPQGQAALGTGRVLDLKAGEMTLPHAFKKNPCIKFLGFAGYFLKEMVPALPWQEFLFRQRETNREK